MTNNPWKNPLPFNLVASSNSLSFKVLPQGVTALPLEPHPGAFGVVRKHHRHEGVDLYAPEGTVVSAVEAGKVVAVLDFTGEKAGSPWWRDTQAVMVEGASGVVLYGEISTDLKVGDLVKAGDPIGHIVPVLLQDKGRPMCMLHLELYGTGARDAVEWKVEQSNPPQGLCDPTPHLLPLCAKP